MRTRREAHRLLEQRAERGGSDTHLSDRTGVGGARREACEVGCGGVRCIEGAVARAAAQEAERSDEDGAAHASLTGCSEA